MVSKETQTDHELTKEQINCRMVSKESQTEVEFNQYQICDACFTPYYECPCQVDTRTSLR